jgi:glutamine transport system permease protein
MKTACPAPYVTGPHAVAVCNDTDPLLITDSSVPGWLCHPLLAPGCMTRLCTTSVVGPSVVMDTGVSVVPLAMSARAESPSGGVARAVAAGIIAHVARTIPATVNTRTVMTLLVVDRRLTRHATTLDVSVNGTRTITEMGGQRMPTGWLRRMSHRGSARAFATVAVAAILAMLTTGLFAPARASAEGENYLIATDTTFAPFEFQDKQGNFVGIDMDLIRAIAEDQKFTVDIKPLGFDAALQAVQANQVDGVIAGMSITDKRKQVFDFSEPYFESGIQMAVVKTNDDIKSYQDLRGKKVAVKNGTQGATFADSIKDKYGFQVVSFADSSSMFDEVKTGNSAAVFEDYPVLLYNIAQGSGFKTVGPKEDPTGYGFAVNKGRNAELLSKFNAGLNNLKKSGRYDEIVNTYLSEKANTDDTSYFGLIKSTYPLLLAGLKMTIFLTVISIFFALILGVIFGLFRVSRSIWLRAIGTTFVDIFRGTPLLVQAFFIYFGIPTALDFQMSALTAGVITLSLNAGAYMTEIVRGGIQSVDKGQMEAARSLGIGYLPTMRKVILPQAIRTMIPSYINQFVITLKDTSILSVIGIAELTQTGRIIIAGNYKSFEMWLIIGIIYFVVIMALTKLSDRLEKRIVK